MTQEQVASLRRLASALEEAILDLTEVLVREDAESAQQANDVIQKVKEGSDHAR